MPNGMYGGVRGKGAKAKTLAPRPTRLSWLMFFIAKWGGLALELNFLCIFAEVLKECCSLNEDFK